MQSDQNEHRQPTSHDVARLAGVSRATVSMVLNEKTGVSISEATREKVLEAARELNYRPNRAGRMLVRGDTETIGVVVTDPRLLSVDGFVPMVLQAVIGKSQEFGYRVILDYVSEDHGRSYRDLVYARSIDGLIVVNPGVDDQELMQLVESDFPVVLLGSIKHPKECSVNFSTRRAVAQAVAHCVDLGCQRIAHIAFSSAEFVATRARLDAYRAALASHGLEYDSTLTAFGEFSAASGEKAAEMLLGGTTPAPDAILAGNDTIALGVLRTLTRRGIRVPEDCVVIGFDDLPISASLTPSLSSVRHDAVLQGEIAADLLIRQVRRQPLHRRRIAVPTQLIVRESSSRKKPSAPQEPAPGNIV